MSRIHEALQKAAQERAAAPTREVTGSSPIDAAAVSVMQDPTEAAVIARPPKIYTGSDDLKKNCVHHQWNFVHDSAVFSDLASTAHGAEQFRTLRSRLYQLRDNQQLQTIMVTSAVPGEGKTFVTSNLARAIVRQPDRSALIIDADLRKSRLHVPLGAPSTPGLTDYLRGDAEETAIIQRGRAENLFFIPGGNEVTNPSELLTNGRLKTLLHRVAPLFDWVILDSPPCLLVADASVLADFCDGVLLVVRAASTPAATAQRACQELHGRKVLGAVLNAVEGGPVYGSYYGYAGKSADEE